jgi:hypothetical protein
LAREPADGPVGAQLSISVSAGRIGEIPALGVVCRTGSRTGGDGGAHGYGTAHSPVDVNVDIGATNIDTPATPAAAAAPLGHSISRQPHSNEDNCSNGSDGSI